jgi:PilZ domain
MKSGTKPVSKPVASPFRINRRLHHRYAMVMRDGFLHVAGERVPCVVRNISMGGLMARVYAPVEEGHAVRVELAGGQLLDGYILWARDWSVGIAFDDEADVEAILAEQWVTEVEGDRRRTRRFKVDCPATLKVQLRFYFGKLCDLSPSGAKVQTRGAIKKPGDAMLALPDLPPLPATIRWVNGRDCGLEFREPIPAEALMAWLEERGYDKAD